MPMDDRLTLLKPLDDRLTAFLEEESDRVLRQAAELEEAMKLHQARMKNVCYSIKAHYHWVKSEPFFPYIFQCRSCGANISPEFDFLRHQGYCKLTEQLEARAYVRGQLGLSIKLPKHALPLLVVLLHRAFWHLQPEVVQKETLFLLHEMLQDLESHERHRDSLGHRVFHDFEGFLGVLHCRVRHGVPLACAYFQMLVKVLFEVVAPVGPSLFDKLVIAVLIEFVVVKGDAIQGFQEPAELAAELI